MKSSSVTTIKSISLSFFAFPAADEPNRITLYSLRLFVSVLRISFFISCLTMSISQPPTFSSYSLRSFSRFCPRFSLLSSISYILFSVFCFFFLCDFATLRETFLYSYVPQDIKWNSKILFPYTNQRYIRSKPSRREVFASHPTSQLPPSAVPHLYDCKTLSCYILN